MQKQAFRAYLNKIGLDNGNIEGQVAFLEGLETRLQELAPCWSFEDLNTASVQSVVDGMIDRGENTLDHLRAMARYAKVIENQEMYFTIFRLLDGHEAMDELYGRLGSVVGEDLRDVIFEDLPLPPLGVSQRDKSRYAYRVMRSLEEIFEERTCRELLQDSLRILPGAWYEDARHDFYEVCDADMDRYLILKGEKFVDRLRECRRKDELFFDQMINDAVIEFVNENPEIGQGVREGNIVYETKIPHNTIAYLEETDPLMKRYHYCHCPWAKESLRPGSLMVSSTFCQCSAGFHKKPYEVIYGESLKADVLKSVLNGDLICRFAIHLPDYTK